LGKSDTDEAEELSASRKAPPPNPQFRPFLLRYAQRLAESSCVVEFNYDKSRQINVNKSDEPIAFQPSTDIVATFGTGMSKKDEGDSPPIGPVLRRRREDRRRAADAEHQCH